MINDTDLENRIVDGRTGHSPAPVDIIVRGPEDLERLRRAWSEIESVPRILSHREEGVECSWAMLDIRTLLPGDDSTGRFCFHDIIVAPGGALPAHYHNVGNTYWWIIEGEVELQIGSLVQSAQAGGFGYAPAKTRQGLRNLSSKPARIYVGHNPAGVERAFAEAHELWLKTGLQDASAYAEILARYGFRFDDVVLENDALTNMPPDILPATIKTQDDLIALREAWSRRRPLPALWPREPEQFVSTLGGAEAKQLVTGDHTAGHSMVRMTWFAPGTDAPPHHQPTEEEIFYVLAGQVRLTCGTVTKVLSPGGFGFAPRNGTHAFENIGQEPARMTSMNSPGGHERGFQALMKKPEPEKIPDLLVAHGWRMHQRPGAD